MSIGLYSALYFADLGYDVLPCTPGGLTLLPGFCPCRATTDERLIRQWWTQWENANVAIRCDHIAVFDVATRETLEELDRLSPPTQKIPDGGFQVFFRRPARNPPPRWPGVHSGASDFVVVGPSFTFNGLIQWIRPLWTLATLPDWPTLELLIEQRGHTNAAA